MEDKNRPLILQFIAPAADLMPWHDEHTSDDQLPPPIDTGVSDIGQLHGTRITCVEAETTDDR